LYVTGVQTCALPIYSRMIEATDPYGAKERVEFQEAIGSIPSSEASVPSGFYNSYLNYRVSYYWDKKAMAGNLPNNAPDYTKAKRSEERRVGKEWRWR